MQHYELRTLGTVMKRRSSLLRSLNAPTSAASCDGLQSSSKRWQKNKMFSLWIIDHIPTNFY